MSEETPPSASQTPKAVPGAGISWVGALMLSLLVSALSAAGAVKIYHDQFAVKVVTVDVRSFIEDLREKSLRGEISEEQMRQRFDLLEQRISHQPPGTVVFLKEVVLNHGNEIQP
ncbi:hypothetical protein [Geoalkalibacter sp.]|uniref:hypothetical protein n=1 Tax=Geoalkalibacter sp. TaxID=3041440 RepID=UPI00272E171E|nr:hypothetical protein [Geoalkalibacter sp.]